MLIDDLPRDEAKVVEAAVKAMETGLCLEFEYDGLPRLVEVHAIGVSKAGRSCMRVFQVAGQSIESEPIGWKMMSIGKIFEFPKLVDIHSLAPRDGYKPGDKGMKDILKEL